MSESDLEIEVFRIIQVFKVMNLFLHVQTQVSSTTNQNNKLSTVLY